jgi:hypothetical protein
MSVISFETNISLMPKHYKYKREDLYEVGFFYKEGDIWKCHKLHNILVDRPGSWNGTVNYIRSIHPNVAYANVYGGSTGNFIKRIILDE